MSNYTDGFVTGGGLVAIIAILLFIVYILLTKRDSPSTDKEVEKRIKAATDKLNASTSSLTSSSGKIQEASTAVSGIEPDSPQGQGEQ